jgi:hypothetical protein
MFTFIGEFRPQLYDYNRPKPCLILQGIILYVNKKREVQRDTRCASPESGEVNTIYG